MTTKRALTVLTVPALLVTGAWAYRAANPPVITATTTPLPALAARQVVVQPAPHPVISPSFTHENKIHGFELNVFERPSAYFLQLAPHVDPDDMAYLVDPIDIGAATLEYWVNGLPYVFAFGSSGNVWVASLPKSVASSGFVGSATLRIWRVGSNYSDASAAAFTRSVDVTPL